MIIKQQLLILLQNLRPEILAVLLIFMIISCRQQQKVIHDDFVIEHEEFSSAEKKCPDAKSDYVYNLFEKLGFEPSAKADLQLLNEVAEWLGTPYRFGGNDKNGVDCSGFVVMIYRHVYDIELNRRSADIAKNARKIRSTGRLQEGDLVFFRIKGSKISHTGIYLGNGYFAHASSSNGVVINKLNEPYYAERFAFGGRVK